MTVAIAVIATTATTAALFAFLTTAVAIRITTASTGALFSLTATAVAIRTATTATAAFFYFDFVAHLFSPCELPMPPTPDDTDTYKACSQDGQSFALVFSVAISS